MEMPIRNNRQPLSNRTDQGTMQVNADLRDKKVLLTGGAGGLGTAITLAFIEAGARVLALDVDKAKGERLLAECGSLGATPGSVRLVRGDLSDLGATANLVDALGREEGGIDVLINNAAIYPSRAIEDYSMDELEAVQRVNVQAAIVCVRAVLPAMKQKAAGRIINVASVTLSGGWANLLPYVTSKGALVGMTRALARELGPFGITVNCVSPGAFPTDAEKIHPDPTGYNRFILDHQSVKRRGRPEDIANAMLFFASDASSFVTGQTLNVDGGWVMH
jgi:NAD(P)-dependent dehydrogenase (short-subunit alcohol dehydrogenase family)